MKKFKFSLSSVLSYKEQCLESLQNEHAVILAKVRSVEDHIKEMEQAYRDFDQDYQQRCSMGIAITDARFCESRLRAMENDIRMEYVKLDEVRKQAEQKRMEVVSAKQDAASIEKLKVKKEFAYQKAAAKDAEIFVEEFVSAAQVRNANQNAYQ